MEQQHQNGAEIDAEHQVFALLGIGEGGPLPQPQGDCLERAAGHGQPHSHGDRLSGWDGQRDGEGPGRQRTRGERQLVAGCKAGDRVAIQQEVGVDPAHQGPAYLQYALDGAVRRVCQSCP